MSRESRGSSFSSRFLNVATMVGLSVVMSGGSVVTDCFGGALRSHRDVSTHRATFAENAPG